ncbi:unnamed protein product [Sphagnum balticum]
MDHQQQVTAASWAPFGTCQSTPSLWGPDRSGLRTQAMLLAAAAAAAPGGARFQVQLPTAYLSTSLCSTCSFLNSCASS